ncbi:MAG: methyltransferase, TIGR04325 family [Candidatus Paceibacterota bacterium]|jgi:putative methyltransferase (TIGR04325 family)
MKNFLKKVTPKKIRGFILSQRYGWFGPYQNWSEVALKSTGYNDKLILSRVKNALLKVTTGEATYERDSVLFYKKEPRWPLLANLLFVAGQNSQRLNLIDFGGSLGSIYFQHLPFIKHLLSIHWNVVEQPNFVKCGQENFSNKQLNFYKNISDCIKKTNPTTIVFSSSLQYIEKPYDILTEVLSKNLEFIIFDRTSVTKRNKDFITLQKVPPQIYSASYPCWFFSEQKLLDFLAPRYELIIDFETPERKIARHNFRGEFKGYLFKLKKHV